MVSCCCVRKCSNRIPAHRFPKDPVLRKKWLIAIRRENFEPNEHSRVCKAHFVSTDYVLPKETVRIKATPNIKKMPFLANLLGLQVHRNRLSPEENGQLVGPVLNPQQTQEGSYFSQSSVNSNFEEIASDLCVDVELSEPVDTVDTIEVEVDCPFKDAFVQCSLLSESEDKNNVGVQTINSGCEKDYDIEALKNKPKEIMFFTGFADYNHFMLIYSSFGDEVNHLWYYPSMTPATSARPLSPVNEFFLTCIRLRRAKLFGELGYMFGISSSTASNIFITWINYLFCKFEELNLVCSFSVLEKNMLLRGMDCSSTVILDRTEIKIQQPRNPVQQQQTYSTYKSCNTVKVLVAIVPTGAVVYVSPAYGWVY